MQSLVIFEQTISARLYKHCTLVGREKFFRDNLRRSDGYKNGKIPK
jgi:hypothetical protein